MTARVIHSESLEWLRSQPDNTIDAIVTDPPYGLSNHTPKAIRECLAKWLAGETYTHKGAGFMGREWDAFVPGPELWGECLRVLKPGGYALVFAGTRTVDIMGIALRLAGFDLRDSILAWVYGSGFPKSLSLSSAIEKQRDDRDEVLQVTAWIRATRDAAGLTNADLDRPFGFAGMAGHWTSAASQPSVPTLEQVPILLQALGDPEVPAEIARLLVDLNGAKGQPGEAWSRRAVVGQYKNPAPGNHWRAKWAGGSDGTAHPVTTPATDDGRRFQGYGTALKPAHEPIIVARKPLDGTHAHNALKWGTGGINVDECGVASNGDHKRGVVNGAETGRAVAYAAASHGGMSGAGFVATDHPGGRWPTNVVLSPDIVPELERQGGDARFFPVFDPPFRYCPKASRAEREAGCEHLEPMTREDVTGRGEDSAGQNHPRSGMTRRGEIRNTHPTVKPARGLMAWLVRLVTPPNPDAVVLDPFAGSGSTGIACVHERVHFVGVELDERHVEIARARIAHAMAQAGLTARDLEDLDEADAVTPSGPAQVCLL